MVYLRKQLPYNEHLKHVEAWLKAISWYKIETIITQQKFTLRPPNVVATQNLITLTAVNRRELSSPNITNFCVCVGPGCDSVIFASVLGFLECFLMGVNLTTDRVLIYRIEYNR